MKYFLSLLAGLCFLPVWSEVSVISVTDESKHSTKSDFYHTFEYYISSGNQTSKCQATRISKQWFATAAHCVAQLCKKNCTLRMDLLEQPISALAETVHSVKKPTVFVHPSFSPKKFVSNDFALIKLNLHRAPLTYYMRTSRGAPNIAITQAQFENFLNQNRAAKKQYTRTLNPSFPPIVVFDNGNYKVDRKLSVISIFGGQRKILPNPNPVYYVKKLGFCYTNNFGIQQGMSGSGVMTNTGELMGIISAKVDAQFTQGSKIQQTDLFMFPVFNESIVSFMQDVMGNDFYDLERKEAFPYLVQKTRRDFTPVVELMKQIDNSLRK